MFRYHREERAAPTTAGSREKSFNQQSFYRQLLGFYPILFVRYGAAASNDWRVVKTFIGFSGIDKIYEDPVDILWEPGLDIFTAKLCPSVRVRVFFDERSEH